MSNSSDVRGHVELLADEFLARLKCGEKPTIGEYCAKHPELAEEIRDVFEALLMVEDLKPGPDEASGSFGDSVRVDGKRLERIADYRILREIGRGGMGVVYEAEQEALGRRVALKVLPKTLAGDGKALIRFQREAKAAARMHHTNIVPVFDVGQDGEHVFYAMQLIHGQGLDLVIDDLKRLREQSTKAAGSANGAENRAAQKSIAASLLHGQFEQEYLAPPEPVDVRETTNYEMSPTSSAVLPGHSELSGVESNRRGYYRSVAQIGLQTASALAYAHARGIIHRDIKPGNLLLDAAGNVWITDFGLAKTGDGGVTHTGDILGTIRYMAPERFRGQCDVRADVYALGLTLYELLALKPAYASPDRLQLIEQIRQADPPTPRSLDPRLPRDLDTIVLKAIDKDPRRRYQSADELAEDLQRFVADEPIKARRIGTVERLARWCRRNPALASSLSATILILVGGLSLVTWKWNSERKARADAIAARDEVEKKAAELAADIESMNTANGLMQNGHVFYRIRDFAKANQFFSRATDVRSDHSGTWLARGHLYKSLGLWELAREDLARAAALTPLGLNDDGFDYAFFSLLAGDKDKFTHERDAMLASLELAEPDQFYWWLALRTCAWTADKPDAIRRILTGMDRLPSLRGNFAFHDYNRGIAYYRLGEYDRALELLQRSLDPSREWEARDLNYPILAMVQFRRGQFDDARRALENAKLAAERWDNEIFTANRRFVPLPTAIDWPEFLWYYDEACKLINGSAPPESPRRLVVHARALAAVGKVDVAAAEFRRIAKVAASDPQIRFACFQFHVEQKHLDEAAAELAAAVAALPKADAQTHVRAFRVYADNGAWAEAKAQHQRAIQLAPTDRKMALEHYRYHADRGEWPQADAAYAEQLARLPDDADLRVECAQMHAEAGRWEQVYAEYAKILPLRRDDLYGAWYPYAVACRKTGRLDEYRKTSAELFERAEKSKELNPLAVCIVCLQAPNPRIDSARFLAYARDRFEANDAALGHCLYRNGQYAEAVDILSKVIQEPQPGGLIFHKYCLAMAYQQLGKYDLVDRPLTEANQAFADEMAKPYNRWWSRLTLEMRRDEAEQLIYGKGRHRPVITDLIAKGEWQAALDRLDTLGKDNELNYRDWTNRGRCYKELSQWDKALAAVDKAIELGADDYYAWHTKAVAHNRKGEYQKALKAFERDEQVAQGPQSGIFHERSIAYNGLRQYDKALGAADRAIELGDNSPWLRYHRGSALAGAGKLPAAIEDFTRAAESPLNQRTIFLSNVAALHVANRDLAAYRQLCAKLFDEYKDTGKPYDFNNLCWAMCFAPDAHPELRSLADRAVKLLTNDLKNYAPLNTAGCFLYRAGRDDEALNWLQAAMKAHASGDGHATDWIFLAMVHQRQGRPEEARKWLDKSKAYLADASEGKVPAEPLERITLEYLIREAEAALADDTKAKGASKTKGD